MKCPVCQQALVQAGRTWMCGGCDGAWVESEVLVPLLEQAASTLVELAWQPSGEHHARACPECATAMQTVKLGTVALDRCESHGVWFDATELAALLGQARKFRAEARHQDLFERLVRVFEHKTSAGG